jgi:glycosyltransferase involved in cell wall biosynthesis
MKIGINVSYMTPGMSGGMEWYVRCLIEEWARLDRDNEYLLVTGPPNDHTFTRPGGRWDKVLYRGEENAPKVYRGRPPVDEQARPWHAAAKELYDRLRGKYVGGWSGRFADLIARRKIDLWFCPFMYALPVDAGVPIVNTIPDLQQEHYPEFFPPEELAQRRLGYQYSCRAAAATVAISRHVADEVVRLYGVLPGKVFAVPLALDPFMERLGPERERLAAEVRSKYGLDQDFIYYPANGWPHKNHEALVRAMARVARERPGLQLVLTGWPFDLPQRLESLSDAHGLRGLVRHLGYVSRADVAGLHAASSLLVFPSLFEGFGLPVLEAMHFGAPVACSNVTSLPEVGGDAVYFFDPHSEQQIADAILAVMDDRSLRQSLVEAGREQVDRFSYARTAAETLAVFRKVHDGKLPPPDVPPYRPVVPGRLLERGQGRWYFRLPDVRQVRLEVMQGGTLPQHLEVALDGQKLLDAPLGGPPVCEFVLPAAAAPGEFHTLELSASTKPSPGPEPATVHLLSMAVVGSTGQELRLVA